MARRLAAALVVLASAFLGFGPAAALEEGLLGAFWNGRGQFRQVGELDWTAPPYNSPSPGPRPAFCPNSYYQVVVRASTDQGKTWSEPHVAATPLSGRQADGCTILDGSTYFEATTGTWHMLTQCLGIENRGGWSLCHYSRRDESPLGPFEADSQNPVTKTGDLWPAICAGQGKGCNAKSIIESGTPDIFGKLHGFYLVSFHGWDRVENRAYRGLAKTKNFRDFIVTGRDLPGDVWLSPETCRSWLPGCIGPGAASTIRTGDYFYTVIETATKSLQCVKGQDWVVVLLRQPVDAVASWRSGWESYKNNPLLVPTWTDGGNQICGVTYARLFVDGGQVFLIYEDYGPAHKFVKRRLLKLVTDVPPGAPALQLTR
jgi:hypothetical protein